MAAPIKESAQRISPLVLHHAAMYLGGDSSAQTHLYSSSSENDITRIFCHIVLGTGAMRQADGARALEHDKMLQKFGPCPYPMWEAYRNVIHASALELQGDTTKISQTLFEVIKDLGRSFYAPALVPYARLLCDLTSDNPALNRKIRAKVAKFLPWAGEAALVLDDPNLEAYLIAARDLSWPIPRPIDSGFPAREAFAEHGMGLLHDRISSGEGLGTNEALLLAQGALKRPAAAATLAILVCTQDEIFWPVCLEMLLRARQGLVKGSDMWAWATLWAGEISGRIDERWRSLYQELEGDERAWVIVQSQRELAYFLYLKSEAEGALAAIKKAHEASPEIGWEQDLYNDHVWYATRLKNDNSLKLAKTIHEGGLTKRLEVAQAQPQNQLQDAMKELNSLIGLGAVKKQVQDLIALTEQDVRRQEQSKRARTHHMLFTGPPGTGKTTVARLLGQMFHALGILETDRVIEVDRSGLVGQHIGETAQKTNAVIDSAMGGILFVDEAYALAQAGQDFGQEAIATLMKRMEDDREHLVVIMAGYEGAMQKLMRTNAGLVSRIPHHIKFDSYNSVELTKLFALYAKEAGYTLEPGLGLKIKALMEHLLAKSNPQTFGNGRTVRTVYERAVLNQARRIKTQPQRHNDSVWINTITAEDLPILR